jgi:hypothetical protein
MELSLLSTQSTCLESRLWLRWFFSTYVTALASIVNEPLQKASSINKSHRYPDPTNAVIQIPLAPTPKAFSIQQVQCSPKQNNNQNDSFWFTIDDSIPIRPRGRTVSIDQGTNTAQPSNKTKNPYPYYPST